MWKSSKKRLHARSRKPPIASSDDGNYSAFLPPAQAQGWLGECCRVHLSGIRTRTESGDFRL
jgi:hypothetical protein